MLFETLRKYVQEFDTRWRAVEAGQLEVKQNLVKFNNFVREKQGKVADGVSFILMEKQKQAKVPISTLKLTKHCLDIFTFPLI